MLLILIACVSVACSQINALAPPLRLPTPNRAPQGVWLEYIRSGGISGLCDAVTIFAGARFVWKNSCQQKECDGKISAAQANVLTEMLSQYQPFVFDNRVEPSYPDRIDLAIRFYGHGATPAGSEQIAKINALVAEINGMSSK